MSITVIIYIVTSSQTLSEGFKGCVVQVSLHMSQCILMAVPIVMGFYLNVSKYLKNLV